MVHGRVTAASQDRPTSFETFSQRSRPGAALPEAAPRSSVLAPTSLTGFDAMDDLDGFFPSDTTGALGDGFFVAAVNSSIEVFNLDGTTAVPRTTLASLSGTPSILHFDPKVVFDQYTDTFVIAWLGQDDAPRASEINVLAIPDATAITTSTWCRTTFAGDQIPASPAAVGGLSDARLQRLAHHDHDEPVHVPEFDRELPVLADHDDRQVGVRLHAPGPHADGLRRNEDA